MYVPGWALGKVTGLMRTILPAWFVNLEDSFSYKEAQFKKVCPPVKTDSPPRAAENISENINVLRFLFNYILIGCKILN